MPNWSYSYALALYKLSFMLSDDDDEEEMKMRASESLKVAVRCFPLIPKLLLEKNNINVRGRSFQTDWPSVLSPLSELHDELSTQEGIVAGYFAREIATTKEKITTIFVERSHNLWKGDDVVKWLFDCCQEIVSDKEQNKIEAPTSAPIALMRYSKLKLDDFQDSFPNLPVANALDPMLVDLAMHVRPNARRMLRMPNQHRGGMGNEFNLDNVGGQRALQQMRTLLGTGRNGMEIIDPDLPIAEVFWRSMMPWARVDGVPPGGNLP